MRVGDRTDYNRLRLTIETDGTISPRETLETSIRIMINQLKAVVGFREDDIELSHPEILKTEASPSDLMGVPDNTAVMKTAVDDLELSPRIIKALSAEGIRTIAGLTRKTEADLGEINGLGDKAIGEIKDTLKKLGVQLKS